MCSEKKGTSETCPKMCSRKDEKHALLRRSTELAFTRKWWSILAMQAQSAAIDCILGQDPQVVVPHDAPPLASVLAWADLAPEPSRVV